jgi:hypothetical protein
VLRRLPASQMRVSRLLYLRDVMHDPQRLQLLGHLPVLSRGVLRMVSDNRLSPYITPSLMLEVSALPRPTRASSLVLTLLEIDQMRQQLEIDRSVKITSISGLMQLHDELVRVLNRQRYLSKIPGKFPQPPFPGTEEVIPLSRPEQLLEEGQLMHNCVAGYAQAVANGGEYIYRVVAPERATLCLRYDRGHWRLTQIKGVCNRPVSQATLDAVTAWLQQEQRSTRGRKRSCKAEQEVPA